MPKRADSVLLLVLGALAPVSLHAVAILLGWALVTEGVARLSVPVLAISSETTPTPPVPSRRSRTT